LLQDEGDHEKSPFIVGSKQNEQEMRASTRREDTRENTMATETHTLYLSLYYECVHLYTHMQQGEKNAVVHELEKDNTERKRRCLRREEKILLQ
jgi:hypothetical protein